MLSVTVDVIGRYAFNRPFTGAFDIIEMMMVVLIFSGLAYCAAEGGHVRVEVIYARLPKVIQANLDKITSAGSVFIIGLITWRLGIRAWDNALELLGPSTITLEIPHWPFILVAAVGSGLLCFVLLIQFFHFLTRVR